MSAQYWLADSEARVLGPIGLEVIHSLHARGKLQDVKAASRDGRRYRPLREVPELVAVLAAPRGPDAALKAQAEATASIRAWLAAISQRPTHQVLKVAEGGSRDAYRAAFFALVHRYVPSRLPPDTTPELRLACEDAFLALSERMVEVERRHRSAPSSLQAPVVQLSGRADGSLGVHLALKHGDARPFHQPGRSGWTCDQIRIVTAQRVRPGSTVELVVSFQGHVTQLNAQGVVEALTADGFVVGLRSLGEGERSLVRTWVARASLTA
jgi:hypothetical protein